MPRYNYKCLSDGCSKLFEATHSMDETVDTCPSCLGSVKKVPSTVSIKTSEATNNKTDEQKYKESVEESKASLSAEKEALKNRVWKP